MIFIWTYWRSEVRHKCKIWDIGNGTVLAFYRWLNPILYTMQQSTMCRTSPEKVKCQEHHPGMGVETSCFGGVFSKGDRMTVLYLKRGWLGPWWKFQISPYFLNVRTCKIAGGVNTYAPHCRRTLTTEALNSFSGALGCVRFRFTWDTRKLTKLSPSWLFILYCVDNKGSRILSLTIP